VLVDFYAEWCGPCQQMAPAVAAVAHAHAGLALVAKLDTDQAPETSARFAIRAIPTVIVFVQGREVARQTGAAPRMVLERLLADALARAATRAPGAAPSSAD
jgi:thioredoxin 2